MTLPKKIGLGFLVLIIIVLLLWVGMAVKIAWNGYQWQKQTNRFQDSLSKPYREDTYGGKTPEETWSMFLSALKKGDVEEASRYFVVDKQEDWKKTLENTTKAGKLASVINNLSGELKKDSNTEQSNKIYYLYSFKDVKTGLTNTNTTVFTLNPYTKVWKISVL